MTDCHDDAALGVGSACSVLVSGDAGEHMRPAGGATIDGRLHRHAEQT
jgi:hypothetical protein